MEMIDTFNFGAALASILLALVAIGLTITFFVLSSKLYNSTGRALIKIDESINKLEKLTDVFYGKFFDFHRETMVKVTEHAWPDTKTGVEAVPDEVKKLVDEAMDDLMARTDSKIADVLVAQQITGEKVEAIRAEMRDVVKHAVSDTRRVEKEVKQKALKELIIDELSDIRGADSIKALSLVNRVHKKTQVPTQQIIDELYQIHGAGIIETDTDELFPDSKISVKAKRTKNSKKS